MALTERIINLRFWLGTGDFGESGENTVDLEGYRCSANISHEGLNFAAAELTIWGMRQDLMNKLTVLNRSPQEYRRNTVRIEAGDTETGLAVCFQGTVQEAWADGRDPPDISFRVLAYSALFETSKVIPPTSYKGSVDAAFALSGIASQIGYAFENNGVSAQIDNHYSPGDALRQVGDICKAANCAYHFDAKAKTLAIWPKGNARYGQSVKLAPDTGMIGYPSFTQAGIQLRSIYNPNIAFGRAIIVESQFKPAEGQWVVVGFSHHLDCQMPAGQWETEIECAYLDRKK